MGEDTPLHMAARFVRNEVATLLLEKGTMIEHQNEDGESALYIAARSGNKNLTDKIIDKIVEKKIEKEEVTDVVKALIPTSSTLSDCIEYVNSKFRLSKPID